MKTSNKARFITAFLFFVMCVILLSTCYRTECNTVELYCSTAYSHNVSDYKSCKKLSPTSLVEKLTKDFNKNNEVPTLEIIK